MLEFAPRIEAYEPRVARLLNPILVPAPVLPPIVTCWLPNSLWLLWLESTDEVVVEVVTVEPEFELCDPPISLIFELYLIL